MTINKILFFLLVFVDANLLSAQETVSFRTDRDTYIAGEFVWLSANCTKSGTATPSGISKVIYIELLDNKNVAAKQLKLHAVNGTASTEFELPETLPTGNYIIRGYTKWMRNYNPALYFTKNIAVINPFSSNSFPKSDKAFSSDTLIFYPEGGKIIRNHTNKITVQSLDKFGETKPVSGEIISPAGSVVLSFETAENGLATIQFKPDETGGYKFRIGGSNKLAPLPKVTESGINLKLVDDAGNHLTFSLAVENYDIDNPSAGKLHVVTSDGIFVGSYPVLLKDNETVLVSTKSVPSGYLSALLIDTTGTILSSRYFTVPKKNNEALTVKTDKTNYLPRSPVSIEINNTGNLKNVTVSVVKQALLNYKTQLGETDRPDNIPFQELRKIASGSVSINDLLICFEPFGDVLAPRTDNLFLPEMKGEIISGTILYPNSRQPIINRVFILSFVSKYPTISFSKTDSSGRFNFVSNRFGEHEIVIQPFSRDTTGLDYKVNLDLEFSPEYTTREIKSLYVEKDHLAEINKAIINMQVNALYSPFNSYPITEKREPNPVCFYGKPEISVLVDKYIELPSIEEILTEIVPFTHITRKKGKVSIKTFEDESLNPKKSDSFCLVDGVPVRNQGKILKMDYTKVEKIDVVNIDYLIHDNVLGHILNLITKEGDMSAFEFDSRLFRQVHKSYSQSYLFNSPDYSVDSIRASRIPDFRNLLFWDPDVDFDGNGKSEILFYTSDEATKYAVVVEGINSDGIIERHQFPFEVKEK